MASKNLISAWGIAALVMGSMAVAQPTAGTAAAPGGAESPAVQQGGESAGSAAGAPGASAMQQKSSQMLASSIIGMPVRNGIGEKAQDIGKITDLVLDQKKQTVNVLIGVGGFLGLGTKDVGVPLSKVSFSADASSAIVHMTKKQLESAPAYVTLADKKAKEDEQQRKNASPAAPSLAAPPPPGGTGATQ